MGRGLESILIMPADIDVEWVAGNPESAAEKIRVLSVEVGDLRAQIIERNSLIESLLEQLEKRT